MRSVAIVGGFAAGKTTLADYLVEHHGYTRVSFARRLKEVAAAVYNKGAPIEKNGTYEVSEPLVEVHSMEYVSPETMTLSGREVLQNLGQSVKHLDRDFWIRWLLADVEGGAYGDGPFVSDDTRFPYEAKALRARDFIIVRLELPLRERMERYERLYGRAPTRSEMSHPSEVESFKIKADLILSGTQPVEELAAVIIQAGVSLAA